MPSLGNNKLTKSAASRLVALGTVGLSVIISAGCASEGTAGEGPAELAQTVNPGGRTDVTPSTPPSTGPTSTGREDLTPPTTGPTSTGREDLTPPTTGPTTPGPTTGPTTTGPTNNGREDVSPTPSSAGRVRASGTGCPADSFTTELSADGLTVKLKLSKFALDVNGQATAAADCLVNIRARDITQEYSVAQVYIDGYAYLDGTSHGTVLGRYWGGGRAEPGWLEARSAALKGPRDWDWAFIDDVVDADRSWSVCGSGEVNVAASIRLDNGGTSTSIGYINAENLVVKLATRPCGSGQTTGSTRTEL